MSREPALPKSIAPGFAASTVRAQSWRLRTRTLTLTRRPLLMGIVNVTPDSFSDGGQFFEPNRAVEHALKQVAEGADLLDIGGQSTRPYSTPVDESEELRRVLPVIARLSRETKVPLSVDTSKSAVAEACLAAGAEIINDVTALGGDPRLIDVARDAGCGLCLMHMQGTPQTMQDNPNYDDVVGDIQRFLAERLAWSTAAGIDPERIALDPGIGFGKTHQHNLTLLSGCWRFHSLGRALVVGHSRKGYIGKVLGDKEADRTAGTIGVSLSLARQGVQILRVHDVRPVREALLLFEAAGGIDGKAAQLESDAGQTQAAKRAGSDLKARGGEGNAALSTVRIAVPHAPILKVRKAKFPMHLQDNLLSKR